MDTTPRLAEQPPASLVVRAESSAVARVVSQTVALSVEAVAEREVAAGGHGAASCARLVERWGDAVSARWAGAAGTWLARGCHELVGYLGGVLCAADGQLRLGL